MSRGNIWKHFGLVLLALHCSLQLLRPVSGKYDLQVRVHRYRNPTHRRSSGYCCEPYIYSDGRCYKDCRNNILHFCLRAAGTNRNSLQCPFGFESTTSFIGDGQQFGDTIADIDNPILFESVQQDWSGTFQLVVDVYDYRYNTLLLIDAVFIEPSYFEVNDTFTNQYTEVGIYGRASITLSFDVYCSDNYYGHNCSLLHCSPTERYTCNANGEHVCTGNFYVPPDCLVECTPTNECDSNGNRICSREFYIPPYCTDVCVDRDDIDGHYYCSSNGSKTCLDNYYGNTCTVNCEGQERQSSCDENGTLVCEDGYYGDNCSVYCFGRDESTGHYECDIVTGDKICLEGFRNPTKNCTERSENRLSVLGGVVGGVLGAVVVVVLVILLILLIVIILRKRKTGIDLKGIHDDLTEELLSVDIELKKNVVYGVSQQEEPSSVDIELKKNVVYGVSQQGAAAVDICYDYIDVTTINGGQTEDQDVDMNLFTVEGCSHSENNVGYDVSEQGADTIDHYYDYIDPTAIIDGGARSEQIEDQHIDMNVNVAYRIGHDNHAISGL